jgi:uncharacterized protein involved in exopolysaccharide biosynthesis
MNHPRLLPPPNNQELGTYRPDWAPVPYAGTVASPRDVVLSVEEDSVNQLLERWTIVWRHKWLLLGAFALGGVAALGISLYQAPVFRVSTTLEIQSVQEPFSDSTLIGGGDPFIQTQAEFLSSRTLADRVIERLQSRPLTAEEPEEIL